MTDALPMHRVPPSLSRNRRFRVFAMSTRYCFLECAPDLMVKVKQTGNVLRLAPAEAAFGADTERGIEGFGRCDAALRPFQAVTFVNESQIQLHARLESQILEWREIS